jgi:hypothetical protein
MKNVIVITSWLLFVLAQAANAQETSKEPGDTVIIYLEGRNQVHITGMRLERIHEYKRADSLMSLFMTDVAKAFEKGALTGENRNVHYLVAATGQRRLKISADPYTEEAFDIEREKKRMELDLPPYQYTIYDLPENVEITFYLEDTTKLALISNIEIDMALKKVSEADDLKNITRMNVKRENGQLVATGKRPKPSDSIELAPWLGVMMIGNSPSPMWSADLALHLRNKYGVPYLRTGVSYSSFALVNYSDAKFTNLRVGDEISAFVLFNLGTGRRNVHWFGAEVGYVSIYNKSTPFRNGVSFGILTTYDKVVLSLGALVPMNDRKNALPTLTLKMPF